MIAAGMRPESWTARDREYLVNCRNLRATRDGAKQFYPFVAPVSDSYITDTLGESKTWPFPQAVFGKAVSLLCFADALYTLNISAGTASLIDTKDPDDPTGSTSKAIPAGKDWHFLDLHTSWMLFNGSCVVWQTMRSPHVWVCDDVTIGTGVAHKDGRALFGGFSADDCYARADWPSYWDSRKGELPADYASLALSGMGGNWVWWSSYFAPDLLHLVDPEAVMNTGVAVDLAWRNEAGARPMPFQLAVHGMRTMGDSVVVYGNDGICALRPTGKTYAPVRFEGLGDYVGVTPGANTRTHWAGDSSAQWFVDPDDELWVLTPNMRAERVGLSEHIAELDRDNLLLAWDGSHRALYIADGDNCVYIEDGRVCRAPHMPTTVNVSFSPLISVSFPASEPDAVEIETGTLTTESGQVETLRRIWMKGLHHGTAGWSVKVKSRIRAFDDWTESDTLTPDSRGVVNCAIPVLEYRYVTTADDRTLVTLEDIGEWLDSDPADASDKLAAPTPSQATTE
jgi:hypothetical protein